MFMAESDSISIKKVIKIQATIIVSISKGSSVKKPRNLIIYWF